MARKIKLNKAGREELTAVPGIGPSTAEAVVRLRKERGGFKNVAELEEVPGIGPQTLENIRPHVSVSGRAEGPSEAAGKGAQATRRAAQNGAEQALAQAGKAGAEATDRGAETARRGAQDGADAMAETGKAGAEGASQAAAGQAEAVREAAAAPARAVETASRVAGQALGTEAAAPEAATAAARSVGGLIEAAQEANQAWLGLLHDQMWASLHTAQQLARCRSPQEWLEVQADYVRSSMDRLLEEQAHLAQLSARAAASAFRPLTATLR